MLLSEFGTPHQTLGSPPGKLPAKLVARVVAGPAYPALVGKTGEDWVVGVDGPLPPNVKPGFGVLILDPKGKALGVMVYESRPIQGAPPIGKLSAGGEMVPLLGIQLDPAKFEDPRCPFFPDSLLR
jgi:hypothetical protein